MFVICDQLINLLHSYTFPFVSFLKLSDFRSFLKQNQVKSFQNLQSMYILKRQCCFIVSHRSHGKEAGQVLVMGQGDVGQLGLGEGIFERKKPALVTLPEKIVQVIAGGMHTVCLSETGSVRDSSSFVVSYF